MYLRFISPHWDARSRSPAGFFDPAYAARDSETLPRWQRDELARELKWFGEHLDAPDVLDIRTGHAQYRNGVCWFRDSARAHIAHARYVCWLLGEIGVPIEELRADYPGTQIWADRHQVVALVDRRAPYRLQ